MNCPYDQNDDSPHPWAADDPQRYDGWDLSFEPTSRLERWLAVKAFGSLLLFLLVVAIVISGYLLARKLVEPRPYTDPSPPPAAVAPP